MAWPGRSSRQCPYAEAQEPASISVPRAFDRRETVRRPTTADILEVLSPGGFSWVARGVADRVRRCRIGISVFAVRDVPLDELAQQPPLVRFAQLTLVAVGALRAAGLELEATGRNPQHFSVVLPELNAGIEKLTACEHQTLDNPYHEE